MTRIKIIRNPKVRESEYYSVHTHSRYSDRDALPDVAELVKRAAELGYPALAITDHGNVAASVQLYRECKKHGIKPMPGQEFYIVLDRGDKRSKRYHVGMVAYTTQGYRNLIYLSSLAHRNFHHKPLLDLADMAQAFEDGRTDGIALTTGCYFGLVITRLRDEGYESAKATVAMFAQWFDTYVEIQAHCIDQEPLSEAEIAESLYKIAQELELPVVITQDSHYTYPEEKELHDALKGLVSFGPDEDDGKFPGDSFHLADEEWMKEHHEPKYYEAGIEGLQTILSKYDMYLEEMEEYNYRVPTRYDDPMKELRLRASRALLRLGKGKKYQDALREELEVVEAANMAGYLLLVAEVCERMREVAMFYQVRGSAAGSLLCYLLRITDLDPLKWKLRFDRFLTKDRTKPPDIDIDIDSERRDELVRWIDDNYAVTQIGTWSVLSMNADSARGSLRTKYLARKKATTGESFNWAEAPDTDVEMLHRLSTLDLFSHYGVHAAGLIICSSREELEKYIPTMYVASSKTTCSQFDMHDVESIGAVKLDVLGVKTLSVIRRTLEMIDRDPQEGLDFIPLNDRKVLQRIASGDVAGVFQLEGGTSSRYIRRIKVTKMDDVIASMALFRPGVMASGAMDAYIDRKNKVAELPERHELIMKHTRETFGILLYQDQVIAILRDLGMNSDDLNVLLKAVKASNKNVAEATKTMTEYEPVIEELCQQAGLTDLDVEWLWMALKAFAEYSFNRAHSTVYGITAYRTAWLLTNYPLEYHAALLSVENTKEKDAEYIRAARNRGLRILRPDVQVSGVGYTPDPKRGGVARGLDSIKGVGRAAHEIIAARQDGPFKSMEDFAKRVNPGKVTGVKAFQKDGSLDIGTMRCLAEAGAFKSLGVEVDSSSV